MNKRPAVLLAIAAGLVGGVFLLVRERPRAVQGETRPMASSSERSPPRKHRSPDSRSVRYVLVGGGATPESTEVSLEQDFELIQRVLGPGGLVLFAGGSGTPSVRVERDSDRRDSLVTRLGELFQPRAGRFSRYRATRVEAAPATLSEFEEGLAGVLEAGSDPLTLVIAAHGERGERPRDAFVPLWGGDPLTVEKLDEIHARHPRPLRVVIAACFSGGFAELAFEDADEEKGPTALPRCGLFAGTWDRQTSGCDPDPDRRAQEGYSLHVFEALRGHDRHGKPLPRKQLDYDGDGAIGWLDAHTRARIASTSIDVPTTTSERFLRTMETDEGSVLPDVSPEESAVIAALGARLRLETEQEARARLDALAARLDVVDRELSAAEEHLETVARRLSTRLLETWPVLDDAYHPDFAPTIRSDAESITRVLDAEPLGRAYREASERVSSIHDRFFDLEVDESMVERLVRAYETGQRASALSRRGGPSWERYRALLACERGRP